MGWINRILIIGLISMVCQNVNAQSVNTDKLIDSAFSAARNMSVDSAMHYARRALLQEPGNSRALAGRGYIYLRTRRIKLAIADFNSSIRIEPGNASAWFYKGEAYRDTSDFVTAAKCFSEVIRLRPASAVAYLARANANAIISNHPAAIQDMTKALSLASNAVNYDLRGGFYLQSGDYLNAISDFRKAIELDPNKISFYRNLLSALTRIHDFSAVSKLYSELLVNKDINLTYFYKDHLSYAAVKILSNNYELALDSLSNHLRLNENADQSDVAEILSLKGFILEKMGRNIEAREEYTQALVIKDEQPEIKQALLLLDKKDATMALADKTPPLIELVSPSSRGLNVISSGVITDVIGKAKDPSGLSSVTINGKQVNAEEDGLFISSFSLKPGTNTLVITATDRQGNTASKTFTITGNLIAKKEEVPAEYIVPVTNLPPKFHAILIAEKDYQDPSINDLKNPVKDALELNAILQNNYTFDPANIDTLFNRTREEIMQSIIQKCTSLSENDNLIIFYAGHGLAEKDKFGNVDGYWVPTSAKMGQNATYISTDDINKALKRSNARHILIIADACFSGSFTRSLADDASEADQRQYNDPSRKVMASGNMEPVPDNSIFIHYLKKQLLENKEKYLTAKKLYDSFYEKILNNSDTSPQFSPIKNVGDEGGQFVFIKR